MEENKVITEAELGDISGGGRWVSHISCDICGREWTINSGEQPPKYCPECGNVYLTIGNVFE
ncbi:MAG: hypothetical protein LBL98_02080 [Ruminococcus sp.]|jgi:rubrerythrin|nr:hypothetical protein [Ruminococcus sp.]